MHSVEVTPRMPLHRPGLPKMKGPSKHRSNRLPSTTKSRLPRASLKRATTKPAATPPAKKKKTTTTSKASGVGNDDGPQPEKVEGKDEWQVERIVDSRRYKKSTGKRQKLSYLVKWVGYDELTWELARNLKHAPELVKEFHDANPGKAKPK